MTTFSMCLDKKRKVERKQIRPEVHPLSHKSLPSVSFKAWGSFLQEKGGRVTKCVILKRSGVYLQVHLPLNFRFEVNYKIYRDIKVNRPLENP